MDNNTDIKIYSTSYLKCKASIEKYFASEKGHANKLKSNRKYVNKKKQELIDLIEYKKNAENAKSMIFN